MLHPLTVFFILQIIALLIRYKLPLFWSVESTVCVVLVRIVKMSAVKRNSRGNIAGSQLSTPAKVSSNSGKLTKKKSIFGGVFGKKTGAEIESEDTPATAPSTPEALNITVTDTLYDPSYAYELTTARSEVSGLTDLNEGATTSPSGPRKVDFSEVKEEKLPVPTEANDFANGEGKTGKNATESSLVGGGTTIASSTIAGTKTENTLDTDYVDSNENCNGPDDLMNQTLGMFDDICSAPQPKQHENSVRSSDEKNQMCGAHLDEDDESVSYLALEQSTLGDSTNDPSYSSQTGVTTKNKSPSEVGVASANSSKQKSHEMSPIQDHENFEVVLDTALLQGGMPPKRRSKFAFSKRENGEEEKKEETDRPFTSDDDGVRSAGKRSSLVKRLFSTRKAKEDFHDYDDVSKVTSPVQERKLSAAAIEAAPSKVKSSEATPSQVSPPVDRVPIAEKRSQSLDAKSEPSDEGRFARSAAVEQGIATRSVAKVTAAEPNAEPDAVKEEKWNSMLTQLKELAEKEEDNSGKSGLPMDTAEEVEETSKSSSKRERKMIQSLSMRVKKSLSKKILKPMKSARKRSKEESAAKKTEPEKKPAPSPAHSVPVSAPAKARKPKPIWKAVVDPKTGRTYYYHRKTRETTWIKPEALREAEQASASHQPKEEAQADVTKNKEEAVTKSPKTEETTNVDEVVVSDDRFQTPTRGKADESYADQEESPIIPPAVVKTGATAMDQQKLPDKTEGDNQAATTTKTSTYDPTWEKRKEIERLLTGLSPPDKASVDNLMKQYEGKEDLLLRQLREKVESQPFDEPFIEEPARVSRVSSRKNSSSPSKLFTRTTTFVSKGSTKTKSSTITDKTEKIRNTFKGGKRAIETISENENNSAATSISSHQDEALARPPIRQRELMVEELTGSRIAAETFDPNGKVTRSGATDYPQREDENDIYYGDNEVDTYTDDSVSALSDNDGDFLSRKENFDQARRRALDDAIEREDWDLAAVLADGMRAGKSSGHHPKSSYHPSELETLIATNDWDAVKKCISKIQTKKKASLRAIEGDQETVSVGSNTAGSYTTGGLTDGTSIVKAPSRPGDLEQDHSLTKRIGSRSQLQHRELLSESSWTSDSSYESSDDSEYS